MWSTAARECVVEVNVVRLVASGSGGGPVASGWCRSEGFVESKFGGCREFVVGEWCDVVGWSVEPSARSNAAAGMVDTHSSGIHRVGEFPEAGVSDE